MSKRWILVLAILFVAVGNVCAQSPEPASKQRQMSMMSVKRWDTSTPYENAIELAPYFKNSKFITVTRGPHGAIRAAMRTSERFRKGIMHFAATGDMSGLPDEVEMPPVKWVVPEFARKVENKF